MDRPHDAKTIGSQASPVTLIFPIGNRQSTIREEMILGHGIDLVDVARLRRSVEEHGEHFLNRVFTRGEREYCDRQIKRRFEHYAARFAAKEAVLKALGTGWSGGVAWTDVEVLREPSGKPGLQLSGVAADLVRQRGITAWHLSLSHTETHAIASAIAASR